MPLFKTISLKYDTKILIWEITENFENLKKDLILKPESQLRINSMQSNIHQKGFLSIRQLLKIIDLSDADLYYDATGKPFLNTKQNISISHSHEFAVIAISSKKIGIDIELCRDKVLKIATKFIGFEETYIKQTSQDKVIQLTTIWAIKEAVFKILSSSGISFKNQLSVAKFDREDYKANCEYKTTTYKKEFEVFFEEINNFVLAYAFEK
jgi:phosphopantetheinyl transferase